MAWATASSWSGHVDDARMIELMAGARGILFAPFQEDYGYVTLEAFLARKPVVTASDSGGPLEFVQDGVNGFVCDPAPEALAAAVARLAADAATGAAAGRQRLRAREADHLGGRRRAPALTRHRRRGRAAHLSQWTRACVRW